MHLSEIDSANWNCGPYAWVRPSAISGVNAAEIKELNRESWFLSGKTLDIRVGMVDHLIVDYLQGCLFAKRNLVQRNCEIPDTLHVGPRDIIDATVYLIEDLGSLYAAIMLVGVPEIDLGAQGIAESCLDELMQKYGSSDSFVRDIFRDYILDLYQFGPLWAPPEGCYSKFLREDQDNFLKEIFDGGYVTR